MKRDLSPEPARIHYRSIFVSDVHLGTKGCQASRLLHFLDHHSCERLYLVGDIVDGWRMKSSLYWPADHSSVLRRLLSMCEAGTRIVYVTGNHDEFLRKYTGLAIGGVALVDEAVHVTASGERFLVVHGDEYDVVTRYHRWVAFLGDVGYTLLLELNRHLNALRSRLGYGYWSLSAWIKGRVKRAVSFICEFEQALAHQCRKQGFRGVICGHIHHAEIRDLDGTVYMNCGDWVESCTALVEDEEGRFTIVRWAGRPAADVVPLQPAVEPAAQPERLRA